MAGTQGGIHHVQHRVRRQIETWYKTQVKRGKWPLPIPNDSDLKRLADEKFKQLVQEAKTCASVQLGASLFKPFKVDEDAALQIVQQSFAGKRQQA